MEKTHAHAAVGQLLNHRQKICQVTCQAIEAMHDERISLSHEVEHLLQLGALDVLSGQFVHKDLLRLQSVQFFKLSVRILVERTYSHVAYKHKGSSNNLSLGIKTGT